MVPKVKLGVELGPGCFRVPTPAPLPQQKKEPISPASPAPLLRNKVGGWSNVNIKLLGRTLCLLNSQPLFVVHGGFRV